MPFSIENIGSNAFYLCPNLTLLVFEDTYGESYAKSNSIPYEIVSMEESTASVLLKDAQGQTITGGYTVIWKKVGSDETLFQGNPLRNTITNTQYTCRIVLNDVLAESYFAPAEQTLRITQEHEKIEVTLAERPMAQVTGTVKNTNGVLLTSAKIVAKQQLTESIDKEFSLPVNNGNINTKVTAADTAFVISCDGYYDQTVVLAANQMTQQSSINLSVALEKLASNVITLSFNEQTISSSDKGKLTTGLQFTLRNTTKGKNIENFLYQESKLILGNSDVNSEDTVEINVFSQSNLLKPVKASVKLNQNCCGTAAITLTENGHVKVQKISGPDAVSVLLFNSVGELVQIEKVVAGSAFVSAPLPSGSYSVVGIEAVSMADHITALNQLSDFGLINGTDYVLETITVSEKQISTMPKLEAPVFDGSGLDYLVSGKNSFTVSSSSPVVGQYISIRLDYEINSKYATSNPKSAINLPSGLEFVASSLTMNGQSVSATYVDNQITIDHPNGSNTGKIRFYAIPSSKGEKTVSASVRLALSSGEVYVPVGSFNLDVTEEAIRIPARTNKNALVVSGRTMPNSDVTVYDYNDVIATTTSNQAGKWQVAIEYDDEYTYSRHSIYAVTSGGIYDTNVTTSHYSSILDKNYPEVASVTMNNSPSGDTVFDFESSSVSAPNYTYNPAHPTFKFKVAFTGGDLETISDVYVVTWHQNNAGIYVPCQYDKATGMFVGTHDYKVFGDVPSSLNVVYKYNDIDIESDLNAKVDSVIEESSVISESNSVNSISGVIRFGDSESYHYNAFSAEGEFDSFDYQNYIEQGYELSIEVDDAKSLVKIDTKAVVNIYRCTDDTVLIFETYPMSNNLTSRGLISAASMRGINAEILDEDENEGGPYLISRSANIGGVCAKCNKLTFEQLFNGIEELADSGNLEAIYMTGPGSANMKTRHNLRLITAGAVAFDSVVGTIPTSPDSIDGFVASTVSNIVNNFTMPDKIYKLKIPEYIQRIFGGNKALMNQTTQWMTDDMRRMKRLLESNGMLYNCDGGSDCECGCSICSGTGGTGGTSGTSPAGVSNYETLKQHPGLSTTPIADPAGFVYEAVPSNRVSGVVATIYEYKYLIDEYGVQSENKVEVKWDAENYDQVNPIVTGDDGLFAWDVPEGQWVVKFTKDGYKDANSYNDPAVDDEGYLPVPIVQTEINTAIVSNTAPQVSEIKARPNGIEIVFSQYMRIPSISTNNISVQYENAELMGAIVPINDEYNYEGTEKFASRFLFTPDKRVTGSVSIQIDNVVNYADKAISNTYSRTLQVDWLSSIPVSKINLIPEIKMDVGGIKQLEAELLPSDATETSVSWSSSNPSVATVNQNGTVTAISSGTAIVTVRAESGVSADCKIIVRKAYDISDADFVLPRALSVIEDEAFSGIGAEMIVIPAQCNRIGHNAFANSPNLRVIFFENGEVEFEEDFIAGCVKLDRIIAPMGSSIAQWAEANGF